MNLEALCLLETPTVRRLVATWPQVKGHYPDKTAAMRKWSEVSGLHAKICNQWYSPLLANEIIKLDGTIDPLAADYIAQCALSRAKFAKENPKNKKLDS